MNDTMLDALNEAIGPYDAGAAGEVVLAPDSPLNGHAIIDGRVVKILPALAALGLQAAEAVGGRFATRHAFLAHYGVTGPTADLCIKLAKEAGA